jgi:hypothetical protein
VISPSFFGIALLTKERNHCEEFVSIYGEAIVATYHSKVQKLKIIQILQ